jgi:hypothetical protein
MMMKRLYVLGACLVIAACAPQSSAPVTSAPPPQPIAAAPPAPMPMATNIASLDGEYAGPFQIMPTGGETTNEHRSGCTEQRKGRMTVRNGHAELRYANWKGHRLHYRGQIDPTGAVTLSHLNWDGGYAQLTGQFQGNAFIGDMRRGPCQYKLNFVRR